MLLEDPGPGAISFKTEVVLATSDKLVFNRALAALRESLKQPGTGGPGQPVITGPSVAERRRGPKGRKVQVVNVEEGSGLSVQAGDVFENAADLSRLLGFKYNMVSLALAKVKGTEYPSAIVQGVEVIYQDDLPGRD